MIALLVVALTAIAAGAAYFGVRGIQIVFDNGGGGRRRPRPDPRGRPRRRSRVRRCPASATGSSSGSPTTLESARAAVGFAVAVPPAVPGFGPPLVFLGGDDFVQRVSFVWVKDGKPKLLLTEFNAQPYQPYIKKDVLLGRPRPGVSVDGELGYWLSGSPHELDYVDRDNIHFIDASRLAGNTLVWTRGDVTLRLEGAPNLRDALGSPERAADGP